MILVTLGTQDQKFYRLLNYIESSNINDRIVVQAGGSCDYKSEKMEIFKFIDYEKMNKLINDADVIITHGGTGSILTPLKKGKKVIACARLQKYNEHINDHQKEIDNLEEKKKKCLEKILKNKEKLGVVYVNLEDIVALDKDGKIIEGAYNDEKQKAEVQSPKEANYRAQEISNENNDVSSNENNGESYVTDNTSVNEFNEFVNSSLAFDFSSILLAFTNFVLASITLLTISFS